MASPARYGCNAYRTEMLMVGLRARLRREDLSEEERRSIETTLEELEADFYGCNRTPLSMHISTGK